MKNGDDKKNNYNEAKAQGGHARAKALSPVERKQIARDAANARWNGKIHRATHGSPKTPIELNESKIQAYVLDDKRRVLSGRGMQEALGLGQAHGAKLKNFLAQKILKPFISSELAAELENPIKFIRPGRGGLVASGYEATILSRIADVVLAARKAGTLDEKPNLLLVAEKCELLTRAFAKVGIIALIDEATGYQEVRKRDELNLILKAYISEELLAWTKRFPDEFYKQMFRLKNIPYDPSTVKRPQFIGKLTNKFIYNRLPPGVLAELKIKTPKSKSGNYTARFHQSLTLDIGEPNLTGLLQQVIVLMRISSDWRSFERHYINAFGGQQKLDLFGDDN